MNDKMYMLVGCGGIKSSKRKLAVFRYHEDCASLEHLSDYLLQVNVGQHYIDQTLGIVYAVDETEHHREQIGGGGYVIALTIDKTAGALSLLNRRSSVGSLPSYFSLDKSKRYALVTHHCTDKFVTKVVFDENNKFITRTQFDDAALVLFRVKEDGSLGEPCDAAIHTGDGQPGSHTQSHLHCVAADPSGELFLVCDKGTDKIYSYHLDRVNGKLIFLSETPVPEGYSPRYGVYHPILPVFYVTNEDRPDLLAFRYEVESGNLQQLCSIPLITPSSEVTPTDIKPASSDIVIHPEGKYIYVAVRGINQIAVLSVDNCGLPVLQQSIGCGGKNPHGLCMSPDGHFLFAANKVSDSICAFSVNGNGRLSFLGSKAHIDEPQNMKLYIAP